MLCLSITGGLASHKKLASFCDPEFVMIKAHFAKNAEDDFA